MTRMGRTLMREGGEGESMHCPAATEEDEEDNDEDMSP